MKQIVLGVLCLLTAPTLAGSQPTPTKKELDNQDKMLTVLKATGAALGAGVSLYAAYQYYEALRSADQENLLPWAALGMFLYPAYTFGRKALALAGDAQAEDRGTSEKTEVETEHKVVSVLKATGATAGAGCAQLYAIAFSSKLFDKIGFNRKSAVNAIGAACSAYTFYTLCYELLPTYINRVRGK